MNSFFQNSISFCGLKFNALNKEELLAKSDQLKFIVTVNASFIVDANSKNHRLREIINRNWSTFDGEVPLIVARKLNPTIKIEKIAGSDLIYDFCKKAQQENLSIFFLGASRISNQKAVEKVKSTYGIKVGGYSGPFQPYPFTASSLETMRQEIESFRPDILLVGFGCPKQEFWIDDHLDFLQEIGVKFAVGSGGTADFVAGTLKRAPKVVQKIGLEGVYRFATQPNLIRFVRLFNSCKFIKYIKKSADQSKATRD
jgi:N-acetylglucosaminyldiphosphoundecaprenol N-acetyl-beta-D-mannosaminyltransferase